MFWWRLLNGDSKDELTSTEKVTSQQFQAHPAQGGGGSATRAEGRQTDARARPEPVDQQQWWQQSGGFFQNLAGPLLAHAFLRNIAPAPSQPPGPVRRKDGSGRNDADGGNNNTVNKNANEGRGGGNMARSQSALFHSFGMLAHAHAGIPGWSTITDVIRRATGRSDFRFTWDANQGAWVGEILGPDNNPRRVVLRSTDQGGTELIFGEGQPIRLKGLASQVGYIWGEGENPQEVETALQEAWKSLPQSNNQNGNQSANQGGSPAGGPTGAIDRKAEPKQYEVPINAILPPRSEGEKPAESEKRSGLGLDTNTLLMLLMLALMGNNRQQPVYQGPTWYPPILYI